MKFQKKKKIRKCHKHANKLKRRMSTLNRRVFHYTSEMKTASNLFFYEGYNK